MVLVVFSAPTRIARFEKASWKQTSYRRQRPLRAACACANYFRNRAAGIISYASSVEEPGSTYIADRNRTACIISYVFVVEEPGTTCTCISDRNRAAGISYAFVVDEPGTTCICIADRNRAAGIISYASAVVVEPGTTCTCIADRNRAACIISYASSVEEPGTTCIADRNRTSIGQCSFNR